MGIDIQKGDGSKQQLDPTEWSDRSLIQLVSVGIKETIARGVRLPASVGVMAMEATVEVEKHGLSGKEAILVQLDTAYTGYQTVAEQINSGRKPRNRISIASQETVVAEFEDWFDLDRQSYVEKAMEVDLRPRFTLLAVPNVTVTVAEILADAEEFGKEQPHPTRILPQVISQYTAEEVSGTDPSNGKKTKFILVPSKFTPELSNRETVYKKTQIQQFRELQRAHHFLEAPVPFVDMVFRHTRRAGHDTLSGHGTEVATSLRSFGMAEKSIDGYYAVPGSVVYDHGQLFVGYTDARAFNVARVVVG